MMLHLFYVDNRTGLLCENDIILQVYLGSYSPFANFILRSGLWSEEELEWECGSDGTAAEVVCNGSFGSSLLNLITWPWWTILYLNISKEK